MEKCPISNLPTPKTKFGLQFFKGQWKWNISVSHYEKNEKFQLQTPPPKFGSPVYPTSHLCVVYTS